MPVLVDARVKGESVRRRPRSHPCNYLRHDPAVANMISRPRPPQRVIPIHPIPSHAQPNPLQLAASPPHRPQLIEREAEALTCQAPLTARTRFRAWPQIGSTSSNMSSSQRQANWIGTISLGWLAGWLSLHKRAEGQFTHTPGTWRGTLPSQAYRDHGGRRATRAVGSFLA